MMNPEDALGLQEDLAIFGVAGEPYRGGTEALPNGGAARHAFAVLALQKDIDQLVAKLRESDDFRSDLAAVVIAYREELFDVLDLLAEETGNDKDDLRGQSLNRLSRRYDAHVERFKAQGSIKNDQRQNPAVMKHRTWYVEP